MADSRPPIIAAIIIAATLLFGFTIIATLADVSGGFPDDVTREPVELQDAGTYVSIDDISGTDETVWKTTGYAVNLTGASDSYVQSQSGFTIASDQNWTVSTWGYVDTASANEEMSALSANGRVIITYDGVENQWEGWYYDDGPANSYVVNVSTSGNEAGNFTNVMVWSNSTHLTIYRNNTRGEIKNITTDSIASAPVSATNWDGRLEEIRTFDEPLDATNRSEIVNSPVQQQPDLDRTGRIMFDQPDASTQVLLFTDTSVTVSNATFSGGFAEDVMQVKNAVNDLAGTTDYVWDTNGPRIQPTSGGELDGAPVAYVSYTSEAAQDETIELIGDGLILGSLIVVVMMGGVVLRILRSL